MTARRVVIDGLTFEGRWLSSDPSMLHVTGPLEYRRPTRGSWCARAADWCDDAGPTGRPGSPRSRRWWSAAQALLDIYLTETDPDDPPEETITTHPGPGTPVRFVTTGGDLGTMRSPDSSRITEHTVSDGDPGVYHGPHPAPALAAEGWHLCTVPDSGQDPGPLFVPVHASQFVTVAEALLDTPEPAA